jgi:hypothetical protein
MCSTGANDQQPRLRVALNRLRGTLVVTSHGSALPVTL